MLNNPNIPAPVKAGEKHVWFIEDIPKFKVEIPVVRSATMYVSTFSESKPNLAILLNDIRKLNRGDRINLIFNSPGGLISEGRAMINTMINTGADIQTELVSEASSMAAVMFCIGHRRIIYENSSLMFHNFSGGTIGKGQDMKDYIDHAIKNISEFTRGHVLGLSDKEIKKMFNGKEYWFGSKKICKRGIATHVNVEGIMIPVKQYLKALKKAKKKGRKRGIKITSIAEAVLNDIDVLRPIIEEQNRSFEEISDHISQAVQSNEFLYN